MKDMYLPEEIKRYLTGYCFSEENIGRSDASVFCCTREDSRCFLKTGPVTSESEREIKALLFLYGKVPVPGVLSFTEENGRYYVILEALKGEMACSSYNLSRMNETVVLLASAMKRLWKTDITDCPLDERKEVKLERIRKRILEGKITLDNLPEQFSDVTEPMEAYRRLCSMGDFEEELVFTHGDFCLPNLFFEGDELSGFLDLGRAGVSDRWQDISLCIWSIRYNFRSEEKEKVEKAVELFLKELGVSYDDNRYQFYTLVDDLG